MKRVWSLLLSICFVIGIIPVLPGTAASTNIIPDGYVGIYSAEDLDAVNMNLSGKYILMNNIDLSSYACWSPIGGQNDAFSGVFDGNGYVITGMTIDTNAAECDYVGLFSMLNGAVVKNIRGISGSVTANNHSLLVAGSIAGIAYSSEVTACASYVDITYKNGEPTDQIYDTAWNTGCTAGGIVGNINDACTIQQCTNYGTITTVAKAAPISIGGIVGCVSGWPWAVPAISNCYNAGSLNAHTGFVSAEIGGIVGNSNQIKISNCYNAATITCATGQYNYIGGIMGNADNSDCTVIQNCYYRADLNAAVGCIPFLSDRGVEIDMILSTYAITLSNMSNPGTFSFDFSSTWVMGSGEYLYPVLRSIGDYDPSIGYQSGTVDHVYAVDYLGVHADNVSPPDASYSLVQGDGWFQIINNETQTIEAWLIYREGRIIEEIWIAGDIPVAEDIHSSMTFSELKSEALRKGYATTQQTGSDGTSYQLTISGNGWQAVFTWYDADSYSDNLGRANEVRIKEAAEKPAENKILKKVYVCTSQKGDGFWLQLLDVGGTAYILSIDALEVSAYDQVEEIDNGAIYSRGNYSVKYIGKVVEHDLGAYYNLQELMNLLNVRYDYVPESQTIMFNAATSFEEDLFEDCEKIFDDSFSLGYLDNPIYYYSGAAYNILGGELFSFIAGNYQIDQREAVVANIMSTDESAESFVHLVNNIDSFAKKAITVYEGIDSVTKGIEGYSGLLDCSATEWLDAYNKVSKGGDIFGFSDFLDIAQLAYDAQCAYSTYATAVKYGLLNNSYVTDSYLRIATGNVYSYYEEETHVFSDMLADTIKTAANNAAGEFIKEKVKETITKGIGYNSSLVKLVKLFSDEVLQMEEMTKAVEHTHICATIQDAALREYNSSNDPLTRKYCAILYLRACQYAYSLYEFDPKLSWSTELWKNKTQQAIETLVVYSDAELTRTVENDPLDMTNDGFVIISDIQK